MTVLTFKLGVDLKVAWLSWLERSVHIGEVPGSSPGATTAPTLSARCQSGRMARSAKPSYRGFESRPCLKIKNAGLGGLEPPRAVLETAMLPLTSQPYFYKVYFTLTWVNYQRPELSPVSWCQEVDFYFSC